MHWAFPSIMVAFIHQNSKSIYAQIFFASSDSPKAKITDLWWWPQLNYAIHCLDIIAYLNYYP
jgi:hypothetical protein